MFTLLAFSIFGSKSSRRRLSISTEPGDHKDKGTHWISHIASIAISALLSQKGRLHLQAALGLRASLHNVNFTADQSALHVLWSPKSLFQSCAHLCQLFPNLSSLLLAGGQSLQWPKLA